MIIISTPRRPSKALPKPPNAAINFEFFFFCVLHRSKRILWDKVSSFTVWKKAEETTPSDKRHESRATPFQDQQTCSKVRNRQSTGRRFIFALVYCAWNFFPQNTITKKQTIFKKFFFASRSDQRVVLRRQAARFSTSDSWDCLRHFLPAFPDNLHDFPDLYIKFWSLPRTHGVCQRCCFFSVHSIMLY